MKKLFPYILIIIGIGIVSFPIIENAYSNHIHKRAITNFVEAIANESTMTNDEVTTDESSLTDELTLLNDLFNREEEDNNINQEKQEEISNAPKIDRRNQSSPLPIGIIRIDKINLKLPIYEGVSESILRKGVGRMVETTKIGEIGNTALAAHRGRTSGRLFNRLNEMEIGDEIIITQGAKTYTYIVYKVHIVEPNDISVLNRNSVNRVVTLITCDPIGGNATHRLIVHGVIKEEE